MVKLNRRNRREVIFLVIGVFVGMLLGVAMMATSPDLLGTAANVDSDDESAGSSGVDFYLADLESTRQWLIAHSPDDSERISAALETLVSLPDSPMFRQDFQAASDDLNLVLPRLYDDLSAPLGAGAEADYSRLSACLGMDDDPYRAAPSLYFYLTIPKLESSSLTLPTQWQKLDEPRSNTLFWQLLDCFPQPES